MGIQSAGDKVSETSQVRILHSAEEDNLSPFDSNISFLCQSIKINNNKQDVLCAYKLLAKWFTSGGEMQELKKSKYIDKNAYTVEYESQATWICLHRNTALFF